MWLFIWQICVSVTTTNSEWLSKYALPEREKIKIIYKIIVPYFFFRLVKALFSLFVSCYLYGVRLDHYVMIIGTCWKPTTDKTIKIVLIVDSEI